MANDVFYLIDLLYEMIDGAKGVVLSPDKCIVVRDDALELLEQLRGELPAELKKAQDLIRRRDEYVEEAKKEAERIRRQAPHRGGHPAGPGGGPGVPRPVPRRLPGEASGPAGPARGADRRKIADLGFVHIAEYLGGYFAIRWHESIFCVFVRVRCKMLRCARIFWYFC